MKKQLICLVLILYCLVGPLLKTHAQDPISLIIKEGITKVIVAVDLQVQRMQNRTIWLQHAQKVLENTVTKARLAEITHWVEKQKTLYQDYFTELYQVKNALLAYRRVKEMIERQHDLITTYSRAWQVTRKDPFLTPEEVLHAGKIYTSILEESMNNIKQLSLIIHAFTTQMSDAKRLQTIDVLAAAIEDSYTSLQVFTYQNRRLSMQRAQDAAQINRIKTLYNID